MEDRENTANSAEFSASTESYYAILGVSTTASPEDLKKGFRTQALLHHPDKSTSSESVKRYEQIQKAWDVLGDDRKRGVYDRYGESGLETLKQFGEYAPFFDPAQLHLLKYFLGFLSALILICALFPILLSLKVDHKSPSLTYSIAFIPLFLLDSLAILAIFLSPSKTTDDPNNKEKDSKTSVKVGLIFYVLVFAVFHVLLALRLDNAISISYWLVALPYFVWELINFGMVFIATLVQCQQTVYEGEERKLNAREIIVIIFTNFTLFILRILQICLLFWKITTESTVSWGVVFIPIWMYGLIELVKVLLHYKRKPVPAEPPFAAQVAIFIVWATLLFAFFGLLAQRLDNGGHGDPTVLIIAVPVFLVLGILLFCTGCFGPCVVGGAAANVDEEMQATGRRIVVPVERRILNEAAGESFGGGHDGGDRARGCSIQ